jgi:hypothetical protein
MLSTFVGAARTRWKSSRSKNVPGRGPTGSRPPAYAYCARTTKANRGRHLPIKKDSRKYAVAISGARTAGGTTTAEILGPIGPILAAGRHFQGEES